MILADAIEFVNNSSQDDEKVPLSDLKSGECFEHFGTFYMVTNIVSEGEDFTCIHCVRLTDGETAPLYEEKGVRPVTIIGQIETKGQP